MSREACPLTFAELVDYRCGELRQGEEERLEEHLFACARCARRAALLTELGTALATLVRQGRLSSSASSAVVRRAEALGATLRSYAIAPGGSVACTAAPEDDFVVVRLALDADDAERVDVETSVTLLDSGAHSERVIEDVAVDRSAREVVYLFSAEYVRGLPASQWVMQARVRGPGGERRVGPYTMNHTPWEALAR